jgi:hypothetical protein
LGIKAKNGSFDESTERCFEFVGRFTQLLVEFLGPPLVAAANGQTFRAAWKANRWSK